MYCKNPAENPGFEFQTGLVHLIGLVLGPKHGSRPASSRHLDRLSNVLISIKSGMLKSSSTLTFLKMELHPAMTTCSFRSLRRYRPASTSIYVSQAPQEHSKWSFCSTRLENSQGLPTDNMVRLAKKWQRENCVETLDLGTGQIVTEEGRDGPGGVYNLV